jgi:aminocarboxymuconate-semialdehyde decarboxylase
MRIDAYTHFFPKRFFDKLGEVAGDYKDMGKRVRSLPALYDLDVRKRIVDGHKDYQQVPRLRPTRCSGRTSRPSPAGRS